MEGKIDENMVLDYVVFHLSPSKNSYEAVVCSKGKTEKLAVGPLDQLALHLREASSLSGNSFKLQLTENLKSSSWFSKCTLARFLHIVNAPEVVKTANAIESEMSQLEETKRFHLTLYAKGHPHQAGDGTTDFLKGVGLTQKVKVETDATKNELIHAMDLRLTALGEKLTAAFNEASGGTCSAKQISDVVAFAQHFGEVDLRNCLSKYLSLISKDELDHSYDHPTFPPHPSNDTGNETEAINQTVQQDGIVKPVINGISPAKIAQAERQSSSESEESSESNDEGPSSADRSRSLMRSSSARRSASPMRRIQIGKSGSRRSTALTIRSLSYFPPRERAFNRDTDETNSGDEESDQPPKKPENNTVRRMSVQDAISLFESKQKEQKSDAQAKNPSAEVVPVSNKKSVLRRWSSGMSVEAIAGAENASKNPPLDSDDNKYIDVKTGSDSLVDGVNPAEGTEAIVSSDVKMMTSSSSEPSVVPKAEETNEQPTASAEWNRQKEAELDQMLMKMMESKPGKYRGASVGKGDRQDVSGEQRGGFYSQYKEKRDEKLRAENTRLRAVKEARFKVMQETLEQSKAEMASKAECIKQDSASHSQRPRRNSAPPVLPKKETPKPTSSRKASPRSPLPGTRGSSGPLPRAAATPPAKPSPRTAPSTSAPTRRKPQATPSPTKASPRNRTEVVPPQQQKEGGKGLRTDSKPSMKSQVVDKPLKPVTKTVKSAKNKSPTASEADSGAKSAKPSLYSKVTKKNSVVPVESKPFLRKGTGIGPGVGPVLAKTKVPLSDESSKSSGNLIQSQESDPAATTVESIAAPIEHILQPKNDADEISGNPSPVVTDFNYETSKNSDKSSESSLNFPVQRPVAEIQPDEEMSISSAAWVEVEHPEGSASCDNGLPEPTMSPGLAPMASTSPHIRHSLSQMLLADNSEPDIVEWGNAEIPPALVYQKDAPKGFKRLLKFGRKNKGDPSATGFSSPSVFSDGEDDLEDSKAASKRSSDTLLRRAALQATAYGPQKNVCSESFDADSKRSWGVHDSLSAADKLREGPVSATATSTKAARSFFSLSAFRSGKSSEAKHR